MFGSTNFSQALTVRMLLRRTDRPFFGRKMTTIVHFPTRIAFREPPTNAQYLVPFVMLIRIEPTDLFGIFIDTEAASFVALTVDPRLIAIG